VINVSNNRKISDILHIDDKMNACDLKPAYYIVHEQN